MSRILKISSLIVSVMFLFSTAVFAEDLDKELFAALQNGKGETVNDLLVKGADINARDGNGFTPLMIAAAQRDIAMVHALLSKGADANLKNNDGGTALIAAIASGNKILGDIVQSLLAKGADANARDKNEEITRNQAERIGLNWPDVSKKLIENHWVETSMIVTDMRSGLPVTLMPTVDLERDKEQIFRVFGADSDKVLSILQEAKNGRTALTWALERGYTEIAELLIAAGAKETEQTKKDLDRKLLKDVKAETPMDLNQELFKAVQGGYTRTVALLLAKGAGVNARDKGDYTALMWAAIKDQAKTVEALIADGADVNAKNNLGMTALEWAASYGYTEIVTILLANGADANAKRNDGGTALMSASARGHIETVKILLNKGVDVNAKDNYGWTALKSALQNKRIEIINLLKEAGAKE